MDAACSVVSTNNVILNRSCRDMGVGASYVRAAHRRWPNKPPISGAKKKLRTTKNMNMENQGQDKRKRLDLQKRSCSLEQRICSWSS
uniref:Uncharacterized protein n=1 Tax=Cucumis melo TaxID=3656 RepID=A0A9I9EIF3_CUCME